MDDLTCAEMKPVRFRVTLCYGNEQVPMTLAAATSALAATPEEMPALWKTWVE